MSKFKSTALVILFVASFNGGAIATDVGKNPCPDKLSIEEVRTLAIEKRPANTKKYRGKILKMGANMRRIVTEFMNANDSVNSELAFTETTGLEAKGRHEAYRCGYTAYLIPRNSYSEGMSVEEIKKQAKPQEPLKFSLINFKNNR